jgi:hypothetical protein
LLGVEAPIGFEKRSFRAERFAVSSTSTPPLAAGGSVGTSDAAASISASIKRRSVAVASAAENAPLGETDSAIASSMLAEGVAIFLI